MKKTLLLLALISFALVFITPQVYASDRDVGYEFNLPVDNAAIVAIDQVNMVSQNYVRSVELRDPGDMLGAKSPYISVALINGDISQLHFKMRDKHGTRINDNFNLCQNYSMLVSTSNGGAGY